ncbi:hypothetical protein AAHH88_00565 [Candidatus Hodgkinia cicadicola]
MGKKALVVRGKLRCSVGTVKRLSVAHPKTKLVVCFERLVWTKTRSNYGVLAADKLKLLRCV